MVSLVRSEKKEKGASHQIWGICAAVSVEGHLRPIDSRPSARSERRTKVQPCGDLIHPCIIAERPPANSRVSQTRQFLLGLRHVDPFDPLVAVPVGRPRHGPGGERYRVCDRWLAKTGPWPIFRTGHEIGPQRVAFYVTNNRMKIVFCLNRKRLEPSLIEVAVSNFVVHQLPAFHMDIRDVLDEGRKVTIVLRPEDHKLMVGANGWASHSSRRFALAGYVRPRQPYR